MKQVFQDLKSGETQLIDVPVPSCGPNDILIKTRRTLVSSGTERMLVEFGRAGYLEKARQQPEKVKQVLRKARTDGVLATLDAVNSKLAEPLPLGYCNVGEVIEVGRNVDHVSVGDRVASNGHHAEYVCVPRNLCVAIPDDVSDEAACFAIPAAIGLQGIRLVRPTLGETVVVVGLGLIGLLAAQMLRANGCRVIGIDLDAEKRKLAERCGISVFNPTKSDVVETVANMTKGRGADAVLLTLASSSDSPISQAARMCRKRGRIVLVGVTGLNINRSEFYEKELSFQVSCSYGPGRYDDKYETEGHDYPLAFVRWTEQRNIEAVLGLMASNAVDTESLVSHRFSLKRASDCYDLLASGDPGLGLVIEYPESTAEPSGQRNIVELTDAETTPLDGAVVASVIGAGNYAGRVLIPALKRAGCEFDVVVSASGRSARVRGGEFGARAVSTDINDVFRGKSNAVIIATRHDTHADLVGQALDARRNVFVEKPLALTLDELKELRSALGRRPGHILTVGFNRRFAPLVEKAKSLLAETEQPKAFVVTVNAGFIDSSHWTQDIEKGGGRLVGEACHFVDLLRFFSGSPIVSCDVASMYGKLSDQPGDDTATISLTFADGSLGSINYFANGHSSVPKERIDIYCGGKVLVLENFRKLRGYGWNGFKQISSFRQDKGQNNCAKSFVDAVATGGPPPIPHEELLEVSEIAIRIADKARAAESPIT